MHTDTNTQTVPSAAVATEWASSREVAVTSNAVVTIYHAPARGESTRWRVRMDPAYEGVLRGLAMAVPSTLALLDVLRLVPGDLLFRARAVDAHRRALQDARNEVTAFEQMGLEVAEDGYDAYGDLWDLERQLTEALAWIEERGWERLRSAAEHC